MSIQVLSTIQEAIDVRLMDVKNISNLIYSYIEYEKFEGPQYEVYLDLGDRVRFFIHQGRFLAVEHTGEVMFDAYDGGIILNGENYVILGYGLTYFLEWASTYNRPDIFLVRIVNQFTTRRQAQGMSAYNSTKRDYFLFCHLQNLHNMVNFHRRLKQ